MMLEVCVYLNKQMCGLQCIFEIPGIEHKQINLKVAQVL